MSNIAWNKVTEAVYAFAMVGNSAPNPDGVDGEWYQYKTNGKLPTATGSYATGKTDTVEIFSTDPYADFYAIDKTKYLNGVDPATDYWGGRSTMSKFIEGAHANGKLALLSIGGWSCSVTLLDAMKNNPIGLANSIVTFIKTTVPSACTWTNNVKQYFDGIDIDLEPYSNQWSPMSNSEVLAVVDSLKILRTALTTNFSSDFKLSFAIGGNPNIVDIIKNAGTANNRDFWGEINAAVDKLNLMTYDYHGTFDGPSAGTNFHTALYNNPSGPEHLFNIEATMSAFKTVFPYNKLHFGGAAYGRAYKLGSDFDPAQFASYQPSDFLYKPFVSDTNWANNLVPLYKSNTNLAIVTGNLGYTDGSVTENGTTGTKGYSITEMITKGDLKEELIYADVAQTKLIGVAGLHKNGYFITYDTPVSIQAKADFVKAGGYGGVLFWSGNGDVNGELVGAAYNDFYPGAQPTVEEL